MGPFKKNGNREPGRRRRITDPATIGRRASKSPPPPQAKSEDYKNEIEDCNAKIVAIQEGMQQAAVAMRQFRKEFEQLRVAIMLDKTIKSTQLAACAPPPARPPVFSNRHTAPKHGSRVRGPALALRRLCLCRSVSRVLLRG